MVGLIFFNSKYRFDFNFPSNKLFLDNIDIMKKVLLMLFLVQLINFQTKRRILFYVKQS